LFSDISWKAVILNKFLGKLAKLTFQKLEIHGPKIFLSILAKVVGRKKASFSFYGEDLVLQGLIERINFETGQSLKLSYIDIGAWQPIRGSNTYKIYRQGGSGTVVEPNPHFLKLWKSVRPRDNFLQVACGNSDFAELHIFHENAASNTLSESFVDYIESSQSYTVKRKVRVKCLSLQEIIQIHLSKFDQDFVLDLDIEGLDEEVITSYDFPNGFRPILILLEDILLPEQGLTSTLSAKHLESLKYKVVGRTALTTIFIDLESNLLHQMFSEAKMEPRKDTPKN
jgi:FkbM family methyltransferase